MATKKATAFFCSDCGFESAKWMGRCPSCGAWSTMVEEPVSPKKSGTGGGSRWLQSHTEKPIALNAVSTEASDRIRTGMEELDQVLGGGIIPGSLLLVGGDPGIGKSTLLLQVSRNLSLAGKTVLYVSGEESPAQIRLRARRLGDVSESLLLFCETDLDLIKQAVESVKPAVVIIDSIQTMFRQDISSAPGSVSQVRECTAGLLQLAKAGGPAILLVGHVTKDGNVAGPRVLEHMVDCVLYFEGDRQASYRILRGIKNRFGSTNEIGVFEMAADGLHEIKNPSSYLLEGRAVRQSGSVVTCLMEGTRPVLLEIQALVGKTGFGMPRRTAIGMDPNRLNLLLAVLEKRLGLPFSGYDCYVNVTGGMRINDTSLDLGIVMAILSSYFDKPIDESCVAFGEIGLGGEARFIGQSAVRIREAVKMGLCQAVLPASAYKSIKKDLSAGTGLQLHPISDVQELKKVMSQLFR
ncbi:MAG: DNA repair protein RadA [Lachnospiraceae bacterium]|nr:DNA repair protein RadA [Lachnospiraceae bacterium]MDY5742529.1 DNA repair protein RadA [Lachnospiraceae bacterium]